jgi:predicted dehydrogenase
MLVQLETFSLFKIMKPKILLVGCGNWGKFCARDLISLDVDLSIVAQSDSSIGHAKELGNKENILFG